MRKAYDAQNRINTALQPESDMKKPKGNMKLVEVTLAQPYDAGITVQRFELAETIKR